MGSQALVARLAAIGGRAVSYFRREPAAFVLVFLIGAVAGIQVPARVEHFQECDSTQVYEAMTSFPLGSMTFTAARGKGSLIAEETARAFVNTAAAQKLISAYRERFPVADESELERRIVRAIRRLNPLTLFRMGYLTVLAEVPMPHALKSFFSLPTASTYSPGPGLFYGLATAADMEYEPFMARATLLTLALFYASVFLLYATGRRLGVSSWVAALAAVWLLFAVSFYSYAHHLGSTIWNVFTGFVWLWFFVRTWGAPRALERMAVVSGVLLFFNYLIAFFWAAFLAAMVFERSQRHFVLRSTWGAVAREGWRILKTQRFTVVCGFLLALLFYPPERGQAIRFSLADLPVNFYYIVLNFFGVDNRGPAWFSLQFALGGLVLAAIVWWAVRTRRIVSPVVAVFRRTSFFIVGIYLVAVAAGTMYFFPSRHLLFLGPPLYLLAALVIDHGAGFLGRARTIGAGFALALVVAVGFSALRARQAAVKDAMISAAIDPRAEKVQAYDNCAFSVAYRDWHTDIPVELVKPASFDLRPGGTYQYMSQLAPIETALQEFQDRDRFGAAFDVRIEKLTSREEPSRACFIGFPPPGAAHCGFGHENNLFLTTFKVLEFRKR